MSAQQKRVDTAANNLANSNTPGFKKSIAEFNELPYQTERVAGMGDRSEGEYYSQGIQYGTGVGIGATSINFAPGEGLERSKESLSLQINDNTGNNFFVINLPNDEKAYTRNGQFTLDNEGRITTTEGYIVDPEVIVPLDSQDSVEITSKGIIRVKLKDDKDTDPATELVRINLAKFINPSSLKSKSKFALVLLNLSMSEVLSTLRAPLLIQFRNIGPICLFVSLGSAHFSFIFGNPIAIKDLPRRLMVSPFLAMAPLSRFR
jgi:flagellar basal-body rod protein FlgG